MEYDENWKMLLSLVVIAVMAGTTIPAHAEDISIQICSGKTLENTNGNEQGGYAGCDIIKLNSDKILLPEHADSINMIASDDYDLDSEYAAEITDYELHSVSMYKKSGAKNAQYARSWRIYRKSDNATMVQWVLTGVFTYDGKTSKCEQTYMNCYNSATATYNVTSKSHYPSKQYAIGSCKATNKKTGKSYSQILKFGVTKTGKLVTG